MKTSFLFAVAQLATAAFAFPWMAGPDAEEATMNYMMERGLLKPDSDFSKRGILDSLTGIVGSTAGTVITGVKGGVGDLVNGLSNVAATGVKESDRRPDAAHPFQQPLNTDQRGPCPGLNTLANHGYLPRNGIVTGQQVIDATSEGFNMAADLSGVLVLIAVAFGGNLETATFSIGGEDDRTYSASGIGSKAAGRQFGLDAHSRCEGDASATRADFFLNNGDNHSGQPDRFKRFMEIAKKTGDGQFTVAAANELWAQNAKLSLDNNPQLYFQAYTIIVILGEYPFIPNFFSNGTYGAGGVANLESISSIMGYKINDDGSVCYQPERFPDNWYRRATPYGVVNGLVPGLVPTYAAYPLPPNPLQDVLKGGDVNAIGCEIVQGLKSGIPASLIGNVFDGVQGAVDNLQQRLLPGLPKLFGCDIKDIPLQQTDIEYDNSMQQTGGVSGQQYTCRRR